MDVFLYPQMPGHKKNRGVNYHDTDPKLYSVLFTASGLPPKMTGVEKTNSECYLRMLEVISHKKFDMQLLLPDKSLPHKMVSHGRAFSKRNLSIILVLLNVLLM